MLFVDFQFPLFLYLIYLLEWSFVYWVVYFQLFLNFTENLSRTIIWFIFEILLGVHFRVSVSSGPPTRCNYELFYGRLVFCQINMCKRAFSRAFAPHGFTSSTKTKQQPATCSRWMWQITMFDMIAADWIGVYCHV